MRSPTSFITLAVVILLAGCAAESSDSCRLDPEFCGGGTAGAFCDSDDDCQGICCTERGNCGGGMCTFECRDDLDCPSDMGCEHDVCFYLCDVDEACAVGQECEHGDTVCEWP